MTHVIEVIYCSNGDVRGNTHDHSACEYCGSSDWKKGWYETDLADGEDLEVLEALYA